MQHDMGSTSELNGGNSNSRFHDARSVLGAEIGDKLSDVISNTSKLFEEAGESARSEFKLLEARASAKFDASQFQLLRACGAVSIGICTLVLAICTAFCGLRAAFPSLELWMTFGLLTLITGLFGAVVSRWGEGSD